MKDAGPRAKRARLDRRPPATTPPASGLRNALLAIERRAKVPIWDCRMCGQCILHSTGMVCPMRCPKNLRNGPCGGVFQDGRCEVLPDRPCVWVEAWNGSRRMPVWGKHIEDIQKPVDWRLQETSSWENHLTGRDDHAPPAWRAYEEKESSKWGRASASMRERLGELMPRVVSVWAFVQGFRERVSREQGAAAKLSKLIELHLYEMQEHQDLATVFQLELRQSRHFMSAYPKVDLKSYFDLIGEILEEGQQHGVFRQDLYLGAGKRPLFGALDETVTSWLLAGKSYELTQMAGPLADLFLRGLVK